MGVQLPPAVQLLHVPALHTLFVPHDVPFATFPVSAQTEAPVAQDVAPVRHAVAGVQVTPAVHDAQEPLLQTLFVPHDVPLATFPISAQTEVPVAHDVAPVRQAVAGVQATPAVHDAQEPLLHTLFVPHDVPLATFPVSAQTDVPVTQEVAPVRQALAGVQATPAVHDPQAPLLHTMFVPQTVPSTSLLPVSEQPMFGEQTVCPAWQGFAGVQACPTVQAVQAPPLHTMFVPQEVPLAAFPDSVQTGAPVSQEVVPVRQGLPLMLQVAPTVQLTQLPVEPQTLFVPQVVPAATSVPLSLQTGDPLAHARVP